MSKAEDKDALNTDLKHQIKTLEGELKELKRERKLVIDALSCCKSHIIGSSQGDDPAKLAEELQKEIADLCAKYKVPSEAYNLRHILSTLTGHLKLKDREIGDLMVKTREKDAGLKSAAVFVSALRNAR